MVSLLLVVLEFADHFVKTLEGVIVVEYVKT